MRFAIIGAGGIGCYYAAKLIEAGETVSLIARGEHLQAMQQHGLQMKHPDLNFQQQVTALTLEQLISDNQPDQFDVLLICLKGMHTKQVAEQLKAWFSQLDNTILPMIFSLQNGVENEKQLKQALPSTLVLGGIARRIGTHIIKPGLVKAVGPAEVILGAWPNHQKISGNELEKVEQLEKCFKNAGIPTDVSANINKELWRKLIVNNGVNPVCTLLKMETGEATHYPSLMPLIKGAMNEAAVAAKANGVELTEDDVEGMFQLISTFDSIKPSMLVDREKGKPLEMEEIIGVVIRGCEALGQDAPYNRTISTLLAIEVDRQKI